MKSPPWLLAPAGTLEQGRKVELDPDEARHAVSALRLRADDDVTLVDGAGVVAAGIIVATGRGRVEVDIDRIRSVPRPSLGIDLAVGVLAGPAMDMVIQKSVELGVERIIPVSTARSQLSVARSAGRLGHWRRVAAQAHKQCHRPWFMSIADAVALDELVEVLWETSGIVADCNGVSAGEIAPDGAYRLLVGPEGGLDPDERQRLIDADWPMVRLGRYVLRAETAAIAGAVLFGCRTEDEGDSIDG